MLPYVTIVDLRFKNRCDILMEYLIAYNEMDEAGLLSNIKNSKERFHQNQGVAINQNWDRN